MLEPEPQFIINKIVRSIVLACTDIELLTEVAYDWLHIKSGFIAHYSRQGFIGYYSCVSLKQKILDERDWNAREIHDGNCRDDEKTYYQQTTDTYRLICDILEGKKKGIPSKKECSVLHNKEQIV